MSTKRQNSTEEETKQDRKHRYEAVLRTIEVQTGGPNQSNPQPAMVPQSGVLVSTAAHGQWEVSNVRSSLHAAIDNGDVLRVRREDVRLSLTTESALRAIIAEQNISTEPNTSLIEHAASLL